MFHFLSIFYQLRNAKHNTWTYGTKKVDITYSKMVGIDRKLMLFILLLWASPCRCEMEYFPGLRRPPSASNWSPPQSDEASYLMAQLNNIIEEQARRRFHQQLAQQHYYQRQFAVRDSDIDGQYLSEPSFTFQMGEKPKTIPHQPNEGNIPFAVTPNDPRYYSNSSNVEDKPNSNESEYDEYKKQAVKNANNGNAGIDDVPYYKLKSPMNVNPKKIMENNVHGSELAEHDQLSALVEKFQRHEIEKELSNRRNEHKVEVVKKHLGIEGAMSMYLVALIAGVSAAVTVGLIALGIGWYTLQKRAKAAADVEYPAYGVTGPNKEISPSGDRRLAQSAQMYHYQHQKQQIIAMENRSSAENQVTLSDVESDDDNEEGDYTVYECPGLAPHDCKALSHAYNDDWRNCGARRRRALQIHESLYACNRNERKCSNDTTTGEMEVKNPLFLDDTPVTPVIQNNENVNQQKVVVDQQHVYKSEESTTKKDEINEKKKKNSEK